MSRAIKFRAWSKNLGRYICGIAINQAGFLYGMDLGFEWTEENAEDYVIEQYTGLKDKNGKEIYEGDIIQCHLSPISSTIFTGVVEFRPGCIMFKNFADSGAYAFNSLGAIEAVIGNIHENPELLEDKK